MSTTAPDTIVLVHGFWVTPRSWEHWIAHYESRGYRVIAPGYPGFEVEVEALNADPTPIEALTVPAIVEHLEAVVGAIETPPIIIGHSAGGAFTQILLDHGFGAAGVALNSAPTEGVKVTPLSQIKSTFPVLKNPANRHKAIGLTSRTVAATRSPTRSPRRSRAGSTSATTSRRRGASCGAACSRTSSPVTRTRGSTTSNDDRAPLLFVSGSEDHIMPPSVQRSNAKHYKGEGTVTEIKEYEGKAHLLPAQEGWEEIADEVLAWAEEHAKAWAARPAATSTA